MKFTTAGGQAGLNYNCSGSLFKILLDMGLPENFNPFGALAAIIKEAPVSSGWKESKLNLIKLIEI